MHTGRAPDQSPLRHLIIAVIVIDYVSGNSSDLTESHFKINRPNFQPYPRIANAFKASVADDVSKEEVVGLLAVHHHDLSVRDQRLLAEVAASGDC